MPENIEKNALPGLNPQLAKEFLEKTSQNFNLKETPNLLPGQVKQFTGGVDFEDVQKHLGSNVNIFTDDIQQGLSDNQSSADKWGNFAVQVGAEILGGTIEGIGYLGDVQGMAQMANGDMDDFGNWLADIGTAMKEGSREANPIFAPEGVSPSSLGWWLSNGVSVASTLSLMIPAVGAVKGVSALGKAMGLAGKMGKTAAKMSTVVGQAMVSRHMENMMEGAQTFEETANFAMQNGKTFDEANLIASEAAQNLYVANSALIMQDILQYGLLARGPKINADITSRNLARALGTSANAATAKASYGILADMATEGVEEGLQYVFAEESKYHALNKAGLVKTEELGDRVKGYSESGDLWTGMFFGALGAGVMQGAGSLLKKTNLPIFGGQQEKTALEARIQAAKDATSYATAAAVQLQAAVKSGNENAIQEVENKMVFNLGYSAAQAGNFDLAIATIDDLINTDPSKATEGELSPDYVERLSKVKEGMQEVANLFQKNSKKYADSSVRAITERQFANIKLNEHLQTLESEELEETAKFPRHRDLSSTGTEQFDLTVHKKALENAIKSQRLLELSESPIIQKKAATRKAIFEAELAETTKALESLEKEDNITLTDSGQGAIPDNNRKRIKTDREILEGVETNADALISKLSDKIQAKQAIKENNEYLKDLTSGKGQEALRKAEELAREQAMSEEKARKKAAAEAAKQEKQAATDESINESRTEVASTETTTAPLSEEEENAKEANAVSGTRSTKLEDMPDAELENKINNAQNNPQLKNILEQEKIRRQQVKSQEKNKKAHQQAVKGADIIESVQAEEPQTPDNNQEKELNDPGYVAATSPYVAETGYAIAWRTFTGATTVEIAEHFEDIDNARALSNFLEDPAIDKTKFKLEFFIDKDRLKQVANYKEGVEEELKALYEKLKKKETLKAEEVGILPVRAYIVNGKGERITSNGKDITTAVHDTTFTGWEKLDAEKRQAAINETISIKEKVLAAAMEGKVSTANIEAQRNGTLIIERNGKTFEKNNVTMATNIQPSELKLVIGDIAPTNTSSGQFIDSNKQPVDELDIYNSATPGAVYAIIKTANDNSFPLRLFTDTLTPAEAELVYNLYKVTLEDAEAYKENLGKHPDIMKQITSSSDPRVNGLAKVVSMEKILISDLLKLLVYEGLQTSTSGGGALFTTASGTVRVGDVNMNKATFLESSGKQKFMETLANKRRQISLSQLSNPAYKDYLISNNILTTNATNINGIMFKQPTTIFGEVQISAPKTTVAGKQTVNTSTAATQSTVEAKKADIEKRRQEDLSKNKVEYGGINLKSEAIEVSISARPTGGFAVTVNLPSKNTNTGFLNSTALSQEFETRQEAIDYVNETIIPVAEQKINAKYDAELAALTPATTQTTITQPAVSISALVEEIKSNSSKIILDASEDFYVNKETGQKYTRVTEISSEKKMSKEEQEKPLVKSSVIIGNKVDNLVRDFFEGTINKNTDVSTLFNYGIGEVDMVIGFLQDLEEIQESFKKTGETVLANGITLYSDALGIAGTVDLMTYDKQGNIRIYDLKTQRGDQRDPTSKYAGDTVVKYESTMYGKSNKQKHIDQLSIYNLLLKDTHGVSAKQLGVLPVEVAYPKEGASETTVLKKLEGIPVKFDPNVLTRIASSQKEQSGQEVVTKAPKTEEDYSSYANSPGIDFTDLENMVGSQENKEGAANSTVKDNVESASTTDLDSILGFFDTDVETVAKDPYAEEDFEDDALKTRTTEEEIAGNITQQEIDAIRTMVPESIAIEVVQDYLRLLDGGVAVVGLFQAGLIKVSRLAQSGDGYHEAFHAIFRTMLSTEQQQELLAEARDKFIAPLESDIHLLQKRHKLTKEKATDLFYEEQLADEFGVYASNPKGYDFNKASKQKNFFERLWSWITDILKVTGNMEKVFKNIQQGKYKNESNVDVLIQSGVIKSINDKTGKPC